MSGIEFFFTKMDFLQELERLRELEKKQREEEERRRKEEEELYKDVEKLAKVWDHCGLLFYRDYCAYLAIERKLICSGKRARFSYMHKNLLISGSNKCLLESNFEYKVMLCGYVKAGYGNLCWHKIQETMWCHNWKKCIAKDTDLILILFSCKFNSYIKKNHSSTEIERNKKCLLF